MLSGRLGKARQREFAQHLHSAAEVAPGGRVLARAIEAGAPLRPAGLAPVQPRAAVLPEDAHHFLRRQLQNTVNSSCFLSSLHNGTSGLLSFHFNLNV